MILIGTQKKVLWRTFDNYSLNEPHHEKTCFCICKNKGQDQLCGDHAADQHLYFRYIDSTIPLLPKSEISRPSHLLWLYSLICVRPGRKHGRQVFLLHGSNINNTHLVWSTGTSYCVHHCVNMRLSVIEGNNDS